MTDELLPRCVTSVLVEEAGDSVTVTWGLGEPVAAPNVEYFGYEVYYYRPDGSGGKRFGVRFHEKVTAHVFDNASATQANYHESAVSVSDESIVVHYRDAGLGLLEVGAILGFSHVNGQDQQLKIPVTLLR